MSFLAYTPSVFVIGEEYEMLFCLTGHGLLSVRVGDTLYYEDNSGALPTERTVARVRVPQAALNAAPVILYHGEEDFLVPCDHSRRLAAAAASPCRLVTVKGADHALAYGLDPEAYVAALRAFLAECEPIAAE